MSGKNKNEICFSGFKSLIEFSDEFEEHRQIWLLEKVKHSEDIQKERRLWDREKDSIIHGLELKKEALHKNILDIENLGSSDPYMLKDLPAGGSRLMQKTSGYLANIVSGKITYVKGKKENVLPGKLVKLINIQEKFKEKDLV